MTSTERISTAPARPINVVDGVRQSTALVYLTAPVRSRPNLAIVGEVNVDRVLLDGKRAVGVLAADGTIYRAGEVILSGGSYGSAAILLRSGIGPAADLRSLGIEVAADLPVGRRLHDQPFFFNAYALAPDYQQVSPAIGSLLWTASSEAVGDELDLHITATHPQRRAKRRAFVHALTPPHGRHPSQPQCPREQARAGRRPCSFPGC